MQWSDFFELDEKVPSGLRWNTNVLDGLGRKTKAQIGVEAGSLSGQGRYQVKVGGKVVRCHRVIYEMLNGEIPTGMYVDHEDGNCANNLHSNLVLKTPTQNQQNKGSSGRNRSGVTGVHFWTGSDGNVYVRAFINNKVKTFSVKKYGTDGAFDLACKEREQMLIRANLAGAKFTERHGKEL